MDVPLPDKFKMSQMALYEGETYPDDQIEIYIGQMVLHRVPKCNTPSLKNNFSQIGEEIIQEIEAKLYSQLDWP